MSPIGDTGWSEMIDDQMIATLNFRHRAAVPADRRRSTLLPHNSAIRGERFGLGAEAGGEAEHFLYFELPEMFGVAGETGAQVFGLDEFALLPVALRLDDAEGELLQLAEVAVGDGQINAEAIPGLAMAVLEVVAEAGRQV